MANLEELGDKIDGAKDMHSVVHTMKTLSAVHIRQYEKAVDGLREYARTIEMGLQVVLSDGEIIRKSRGLNEPVRPLAVVFGSDQGLAGRFNEVIVDYMLKYYETKMPDDAAEARVLSVGRRGKEVLQEQSMEPLAHRDMPGTIGGIRAAVSDVVDAVLAARDSKLINTVHLFHNRMTGQASYEPAVRRILPVDAGWLKSMAEKEWPTRIIPTYRQERDALFRSLVESWLFVVLYMAFVESSAAEHASRLAAMQMAEKNIEERIDNLTGEYRQARQEAITGEMLEIVSGFEAMK